MLRSLRDCLAQLLLRGRAEAWQTRDRAAFARLLELLDRADVQLLVKRLDLLRAQTGNRKQFKNSRRKLRAQLVVIFGRTALCQLLYLRSDRLADAGNLRQ